MIDWILSPQLNPYACGVAKFNWCLAAQIGCPVRDSLTTADEGVPLISAHRVDVSIDILGTWLRWTHADHRYDLWLHDDPSDWPLGWIRRARRVFTAHAGILEALGPVRQDAHLVWCPSTLPPSTSEDFPPPAVLTFGMAHKLVLPCYRALAALMAPLAKEWTLEVSTAIHDGTPWPAGLASVESQLAAIFGPRLRFWGALSNWAVAWSLQRVSVVALFYAEGACANSTTLWAALRAGLPVITNLGAWSPAELRHDETVYDVTQLTAWPDLVDRDRVGIAGQAVAARYSWHRLLEVLRCER